MSFCWTPLIGAVLHQFASQPTRPRRPIQRRNGNPDRDFCPPNRLTLPVSFFLTFTVSGLLDLLNDGPIYKSQSVSNESFRAGRTGATQQDAVSRAGRFSGRRKKAQTQLRRSRTQFHAVSGPSLSRCKQRLGKALRLIVAATTPRAAISKRRWGGNRCFEAKKRLIRLGFRHSSLPRPFLD